MKRKIVIAVAASGLAGLLAIIGAAAVVRGAAKDRTYSDVELVPRRRVGIVLGCAQRVSSGGTNIYFAYRVSAAAQLYKAGKVEYLIVSGDNHVVGYDEATDMKDALVRAGVPEERVYRDYAGFRTLDSVVRAREIFGQTEVTVVSQQFHNQRAIYIAAHKGVDAIGFNAQEVVAAYSLRTRAREQLARVKAVLDVYLLRTKPKFLGPSIAIGEVAQADQPAG